MATCQKCEEEHRVVGLYEPNGLHMCYFCWRDAMLIAFNKLNELGEFTSNF
jgi:hypothetical protein